MKISVKKYLLYSSVFAIFTEEFFIRYIIDWKLLYLIIIVNYFLLVQLKKIKINPYFLAMIGFFLVHGIINYTVIGIPYNFMLSQILGIAIVGTYFYNVIPLFTKNELTKVYVEMCLVIAFIGYAMFFLGYNTYDNRLKSILREPAHYVIIIIPACYYFYKNKKYFSFAFLFGTLILSSSSLGYIGCGLMFLIPNLTLKRVGYLVALIPIIFVVFQFVYKEFPFFKMRVDDTYNSLNVINTGKFDKDTNLSSYVMIANIFIAKKNVTDHPLGSGIGSHHYMNTQVYMKEMHPPDYLRYQGRHVDNSFDANSLFTRLVSEFGLFGFLFVIYCLYLASKCFETKDYLIQGIFIYFLLKLFRDGHYFPPEFFFFIWLFYYSFKDEKFEPH